MELHELDPKGRFSGRASDYAKCRPDYSDESIRAILSGFDQPIVADVGAGTGISSRRLAMNGAQVVAIEPNEAMIASAESHPGVEFRVGSAEETKLNESSVDVVTCFQAFHWFRAHEALGEFARVLRRRGRVALVWNERDESDPFTAEYGYIIRKASNDHPAEKRLGASRAIYETPLFSGVQHQRFSFEQTFDEEGLLGRARSASYLPKEGLEYDAMSAALHALFEKWRSGNGVVTLKYTTEVFLATAVK